MIGVASRNLSSKRISGVLCGPLRSSGPGTGNPGQPARSPHVCHFFVQIEAALARLLGRSGRQRREYAFIYFIDWRLPARKVMRLVSVLDYLVAKLREFAMEPKPVPFWFARRPIFQSVGDPGPWFPPNKSLNFQESRTLTPTGSRSVNQGKSRNIGDIFLSNLVPRRGRTGRL